MTQETNSYRYDTVTMGLLMSDFAFGKDSARPGDVFPDFELTTTTGQMIRNSHLIGQRPLLLVFGSKTCPMTASSIAALRLLYDEFGSKVEFVTLNVREAHPAEQIPQPKSFKQKLENARAMKSEFGIPWLVAVDDIDGTLHRSLDPKPNAAYLVNNEGRIVFRSLWAGDAKALRCALHDLTTGHLPTVPESTSTLAPLTRGIGFFHEVLHRAGPQAIRDMLKAAPPIAIAGQIAALFGRITPARRGAPALLVLAIGLAGLVTGVMTWIS